MSAGPLTPSDLELLAFARIEFPTARGAREATILDRFGDSLTRYHQRLNALLDHPAAVAYDAELVNRLRRIRAAKAAARQSTRKAYR